jgi:ABC-type Fe3+-hydroxamate transport system substrate-binding protein
MHLRGPSAALFFIASILLAGLLAGCAGGGDQAGNGGSQGGEGGQGQAAQGEGTQANALQFKIALGTIVSVKPDRRKIVLRPSTEQQGDRLIFKVVDDAVITLNDQTAEMADVQEGLQAQIEYITVNEQNKARIVELINSGEETGG